MKKTSILVLLVCLLTFSLGFSQSYLEEVRACKYLEQGKADQAIRLLNMKLRRYPRNYDCHLYLGLAYYLKEDWENAMKTLIKVEFETEQMKLSPSSVTSDVSAVDLNQASLQGGVVFTKARKGILKYALGMLYKKQKDHKNAKKRFEEAVKHKYPEIDARKQLAMTYCLLKDYKKAKKELDKIRKSGEPDNNLKFLDAYLAYNLKQEKQAAEGFSALADEMLMAQRNLAVIHYNQGNYQQALDIWLDILSQLPKDANAMMNSGRAYHHLGQTEKGQEQFDSMGMKMKVDKYSPKKITLFVDDLFPDVQFDFFCSAK